MVEVEQEPSQLALAVVADPLFANCDWESLARLMNFVEPLEVSAGATIYSEGDEANVLYIVTKGRVQLKELRGHVAMIDHNERFGEETGTEVPHYLTDAIAVTDSSLLTIPWDPGLEDLISNNETLAREFYFSLVARLGSQRIKKPKAEVERDDPNSLKHFVGWTFAGVAPLLFTLFANEIASFVTGEPVSVTPEVRTFIAVFLAAAIMWGLELVEEFIPGIFAILVVMALSLAPPSIVLKGFGSDGFFLALSIFGLGTVIQLSGLNFRLMLWLLKVMPNNLVGYNAGLLSAGLLLTPVVPSINGRSALIGPFLNDMVDSLGYRYGGRTATQLAVTVFTGATLFSACFLTSRSINFVIHGLFPEELQGEFQFVFWFTAALVPLFVMLVLFAIWNYLFFLRGVSEEARLTPEKLRTQLMILGPMRNRETAALLGVSIFAIGVLTVSYHDVHPPWLGLFILFGLLIYNYLNKSEFREKTDWPALVYLGSLIGLVGVFNHLGLGSGMSNLISTHTSLAYLLSTNLNVFFLHLIGLVVLIRFILPNNATIAICATIFLPLAIEAGLNPWVIGFSLLLVGDLWFFKYQCPHYFQFIAAVKDNLFDESKLLWANIGVNVIRVIGVYAGILYWESLDLLPASVAGP